MSKPPITQAQFVGLVQYFEAMPFAQFMGFGVKIEAAELISHLPYRPDLIGNPVLPALHGGAIGAFLELTAMAQLKLQGGASPTIKPINISVQYLRPGKPQSVFARARLNRFGRTIANLDVIAWQDTDETVIASLQAHFLTQSR